MIVIRWSFCRHLTVHIFEIDHKEEIKPHYHQCDQKNHEVITLKQDISVDSLLKKPLYPSRQLLHLLLQRLEGIQFPLLVLSLLPLLSVPHSDCTIPALS